MKLSESNQMVYFYNWLTVGVTPIQDVCYSLLALESTKMVLIQSVVDAALNFSVVVENDPQHIIWAWIDCSRCLFKILVIRVNSMCLLAEYFMNLLADFSNIFRKKSLNCMYNRSIYKVRLIQDQPTEFSKHKKFYNSFNSIDIVLRSAAADESNSQCVL